MPPAGPARYPDEGRGDRRLDRPGGPERPWAPFPRGPRPPFDARDRRAPHEPDRAPAPDDGRPARPGPPAGPWRGPASGPGRPRPARPARPWERRESDEQRLHRSYPAAEAAGLVAPGEELVAGRHPVEEALAARRHARRLLVVPHRREALERIVLHATTLRIPIVEVEGGTLTALAGFDGHQGVAVVLQERRFASLDDVLARAIECGEPPFVLALDSLEDPQNLGSLLRSAEAAGVHGVLFPIRRQAPLTPAAVKASAGAVEHLLLVPVDDLAGALADLHVRGVRVVGAEADAALTHREADLRGPVALVVGHEGQGLGPAVRRRCDLLVRIPMRGRIASLNAAVAGSVLLFEASGQRGEVPPPPPAAHDDEPPAIDGPQEGDGPRLGDMEAGEPVPHPRDDQARKPGPVPKARKGRNAGAAPASGDSAGSASPEPAAKGKRARRGKGAGDPAGAAEAGPAARRPDELLPGGPPATDPATRHEPPAKPKHGRKAAAQKPDPQAAPDPPAKTKRARSKP